jgi:hypothetical protein
MKSLIVASLWLLFLSPASAFSKESCYDCHGIKGMKDYVDRTLFEQSVHTFLACTKCHVDVSEIPHGKVSKVNCGICHFLGREGAPKEQALEYRLSVHGNASASGNTVAPTCQTCHGSHYIYPSADARSATNRLKIPALCSQCHPQQFDVYKTSIHGKQLLDNHNIFAPTCFDCHLEHLTPPTSNNLWQLSLIKQCGTCHSEEMKTYRKTYHGKVTKLGYSTVAKCSDCHGSHNIQAVDSPQSSLSEQNILSTCRKCHAGATVGFTKYYAHAEESNKGKYPVLYYTFLFMTMLLIGVFAFFLTHTFLWAYRSMKERMRKKGDE